MKWSPDIITEMYRERIPDSCFWMRRLSLEEKGENAFDSALIASSFTDHRVPLPLSVFGQMQLRIVLMGTLVKQSKHGDLQGSF